MPRLPARLAVGRLALVGLVIVGFGTGSRTSSLPGSIIVPPGAFSLDGREIAWTEPDGIWVSAPDFSRARRLTGPVGLLDTIAWVRHGWLLHWSDYRLFLVDIRGASATFADKTGIRDTSVGPEFSVEATGTHVAVGVTFCSEGCSGPVRV